MQHHRSTLYPKRRNLSSSLQIPNSFQIQIPSLLQEHRNLHRSESISVITNDGRNIVVGALKGFDHATNVILDEFHERVFSTKVHSERKLHFSVPFVLINMSRGNLTIIEASQYC
ncbi:Small nuclear ribonucleoprotein family protein [Trifolium repens]|nr:Small nuclear ribonucleoprotein family protein [Trifolium repens]